MVVQGRCTIGSAVAPSIIDPISYHIKKEALCAFSHPGMSYLPTPGPACFANAAPDVCPFATELGRQPINVTSHIKIIVNILVLKFPAAPCPAEYLTREAFRVGPARFIGLRR